VSPEKSPDGGLFCLHRGRQGFIHHLSMLRNDSRCLRLRWSRVECLQTLKEVLTGSSVRHSLRAKASSGQASSDERTHSLDASLSTIRFVRTDSLEEYGDGSVPFREGQRECRSLCIRAAGGDNIHTHTYARCCAGMHDVAQASRFGSGARNLLRYGESGNMRRATDRRPLRFERPCNLQISAPRGTIVCRKAELTGCDVRRLRFSTCAQVTCDGSMGVDVWQANCDCQAPDLTTSVIRTPAIKALQ
jgi:hypothetical protein